MYRALRGEKEQVDWKKTLFSNYAHPRATFTLWFIFMGRLDTKDRLRKFGITTDRACVYYDHTESMEHLFFIVKTQRAYGKTS